MSETPDFRSIFESSPGLYLVLTPDLKIIAVSDSYLKATMTRRDNILGRGLFEVFPDNPDDPTADGVGNLRASLDRGLKKKAADRMVVQRYDIQDQGSQSGGKFEERYWGPFNSPVFKKGTKEIEYIIHCVEDVTEFVHLKTRGVEQGRLAEEMKTHAGEQSRRADELARVNRKLEEFSRNATGREIKMIELKRQVNALSQELLREPPYDLSFTKNSIES